jgi:hypothetical protein
MIQAIESPRSWMIQAIDDFPHWGGFYRAAGRAAGPVKTGTEYNPVRDVIKSV